MDKKTLLELFFTSLSKMKRQMELHSNSTVEERVATMLQLQTLSFLADNPNSTPSQLATILCLSSSSAAQLTDRLVNSGWIDRQHDKKDRRVVHLSLTSAGQEQLASLRTLRQKKMEPILKHVNKEDLEQLVHIMNNISIALEKGAQK
ncbi:MAG TPA: MarR family transcriptional regulator [Patescibacteria group bacterium]|nr:MarR family transcriptional regulator [Patescibacteria group bacterium]